MKEGTLVAKIKKYLIKNGAYCENIWGGGFQAAGIPDIIACYKGVFLGIEVKLSYNHASPIQKAKIKLINNAGGKAIVAYGLDDVKELLEQIDREMETDSRN